MEEDNEEEFKNDSKISGVVVWGMVDSSPT